MRGVWEAFGSSLGGVQEEFGRSLAAVWEFGSNFGRVWE